MSFNKMDPSCAIGFYCRTREDFDRFCKEAKQVLIVSLSDYTRHQKRLDSKHVWTAGKSGQQTRLDSGRV